MELENRSGRILLLIAEECHARCVPGVNGEVEGPLGFDPLNSQRPGTARIDGVVGCVGVGHKKFNRASHRIVLKDAGRIDRGRILR